MNKFKGVMGYGQQRLCGNSRPVQPLNGREVKYFAPPGAVAGAGGPTGAPTTRGRTTPRMGTTRRMSTPRRTTKRRTTMGMG